MTVEAISCTGLPKAHGAYSHGTKCGGMILTSGQIPTDNVTGKMITDIKQATREVLDNLLKVVEAGGGRLDTVAKVDVYLKNLEDFKSFNEVYADFFGVHKPARVTSQAGDLFEGALLEISMIAFVA
ncbi:MAG: Rid family detoxifying hydrolase [Treponema sp.]|jgi:2-iminobutanoate/2-iminopropanoate deaminase|nr:Rid family detoxifying hydrolase [Treponema sp.]